MTVLLRTSAAVYLGTPAGEPRLVLVDDGGITVPDSVMMPPGLRWRDFLTAQGTAPILVGGGQLRCGPRTLRVRMDIDLRAPAITTTAARWGRARLRSALASAVRRRTAWPVVRHHWSTGTAAPQTLAMDAPRLIGRGPGVTPSGDDILAGAILAHVALGTPGIRAAATSVTGRATGRTTAASIVSLRGAADGRAAAPLRELLSAIRDQRDLTSALHRVLALGHTSGADLIRGLYDGFEAAAGAPTHQFESASGAPAHDQFETASGPRTPDQFEAAGARPERSPSPTSIPARQPTPAAAERKVS